MLKERILQEAENIKDELIKNRRYLHENAETGFDLENTLSYVEKELVDMGYSPVRCGKAGLVALAGNQKGGKTFLIRADMDALPIREETDLPFASKGENMHACGHDMHTAMLLGAAKILKKYENEIEGTVKLMFQPAEEIFGGSDDMIKNGVLENPSVDSAFMIHVMTNMMFKAGTAIISSPGVSAPCADCFEITIQGKGCHGSMPNTGVDPINAASHLIIALQEINSRELSMNDKAVITVGKISGGTAPNVIADSVTVEGTIRTYSEETRSFIKERIKEMAFSVAATFRASAKVNYGSGCPTLVNDGALSKCTYEYAKELLGEKMAFSVEELNRLSDGKPSSQSAGSEDFAYVSQKVPSIMVALASGQTQNGYCYPQHHPKVTFDEDALAYGASLYAYVAMKWLKDNK